MRLTKKKYKVVQLTENKEEYILEEVFWILGIDLWGTYYSYDGMAGRVPFNDYSAAREKMRELIKKEKKNRIDRELKIIWITTFILLVVVFSVGYKYLG